MHEDRTENPHACVLHMRAEPPTVQSTSAEAANHLVPAQHRLSQVQLSDDTECVRQLPSAWHDQSHVIALSSHVNAWHCHISAWHNNVSAWHSHVIAWSSQVGAWLNRIASAKSRSASAEGVPQLPSAACQLRIDPARCCSAAKRRAPAQNRPSKVLSAAKRSMPAKNRLSKVLLSCQAQCASSESPQPGAAQLPSAVCQLKIASARCCSAAKRRAPAQNRPSK
eukprot:360997-Chlamydomonas_euryale.AAC.5